MSLTVAQALAQARALGLARLDAQLLLAHATGRPRTWVMVHDLQELEDPLRRHWQALIERRANGEPLAYLTGTREFHGLCLRVTPAVLVPRPETELLVDWALECLAPEGAGRLLDLGTGSGAVALAVKQARPDCEVTAVDISEPALEVARANGARLGLPVRWLQSDWFAALAGQTYDVIAANPPYVAEGDAHLTELRHEPQLALTSGPDGLHAIRALVGAARAHLSSAGWLLLEHGADQAAAVSGLLHDHHFAEIQTRSDLAGKPRCTGARQQSP